jgi:hypothetical protein
MAALQLDQRCGVPPYDPLQELGVSDQGTLGGVRA